MTASPGRLPPPEVPGLTGLSVLARGGYATVYRAVQESVARDVAVKVENRTLDSDRDQRRFLREARAAGRMSAHPHVVDLIDAGVTADQHPYLIMELCAGSYAEVMRNALLSPVEACEVGVKIADALADAHYLGVLHRDVKPANILFTRFREPVLADFGLAVLAEVRDSSITLEVLTPAYAAPEMFRHGAPSPAVDVYALCATLYALMRGRPPRWREDRNPSLISLMEMFSEPIPDLPGVPPEMMAVLRVGMANEPTDRPSAGQLRDWLMSLRLDPPPEPPAAPGAAPGSPVPQAPPVPGAPVSGSPVSGGPFPGSPVSGGPFPGSPVSGGPTAWTSPLPSRQPPLSPRPVSWADQSPSGQPPPWGQPVSEGANGAPVAAGGAVDFGSPHAVTVPHPAAGGAAAGQPAPPAPGAPDPQRRLALWAGAAVLALVLVAGAAVAFWPKDNGHVAGPSPSPGTGTPGPTGEPSSTGPTPSGTGSTSITGSCLIEQLGTGARCPAGLECYGAMTKAGGVNTADQVSCTGRHTWEVFAVGDLPPSVTSVRADVLAGVTAVTSVCSALNLQLVSLDLGVDKWQITVLPPSSQRFASGERTFRCLAGMGAGALTGPTLSIG